MKILISGYNGFLGRHLIRKLKCLKEEYDIDFLTKADFESNNLQKKISPNDIIFILQGLIEMLAMIKFMKKIIL